MFGKNLLKRMVLLVIVTLFFGCVGVGLKEPSSTSSLAQERLFLRKVPLVENHVLPTIPFPSPSATRTISLMGVGSSMLNVVAPDFLDGAVDFIGESIIKLSGKNDKTTTVSAELSNFFYKDATYNVTPQENQPVFNLLFISGNFGEQQIAWQPKGLDSLQKEALERLYLATPPNFFMEAKLFPLPHKQYMEIVPTYIFYNKKLNSKGFDGKRDLAIRFSFYDLDSKRMVSEGSVILKNVQVGKEYGEKELASMRTPFMKMPKISEEKKGYSGGYRLKVSVTETRDINRWLASLGEKISHSEKKIRSQFYLSEDEKIEQNRVLANAKIDVEIAKEKLEEAKRRGASTTELLELKRDVLEKKATANKKAIAFGMPRIY